MKRITLLTALALCLVAGCHKNLGPDADPDAGGKALQTALEAWKSGAPQADLEKRQPPILMNEDDWGAGKRLLDFKVEETAMSGRQVRSRVRIKLRDRDGKTLEQRATYIIDTTPRIVIVRDTFAS